MKKSLLLLCLAICFSFDLLAQPNFIKQYGLSGYAFDLVHMHGEDTTHNALLWARYTDAELLDLHAALVGSIPPDEMMLTLRWMLPAMAPQERSAMLADMQAHAPAPAFEAALEVARLHLDAPAWAALSRSLGLAPAAGLVTA